jgi:tetratricopeptide (TPR) repeat protein
LILLLALPLSGQTIDDAIALHEAGRLREALQAYRAAASDPKVAGVAVHNACALQMDLGDYRAALPDCREALRLARSEGDPEVLGQALNNLGLALQALGDYGEAEARFREALTIGRRSGNAEEEAVVLSNLGALAISAGRYAAAMAFHNQAADLAARHSGEPWAAEQAQIARINQGVVLEKLGAYREALDLYRDLLARRDEIDPWRRAALLVNSGVIYRNLGDPVSAAGSFREAIEEYGRLGDTAALSNAWLNLALASHLNLERPKEAEAAYREALRLAGESGDRTEEIQDLFYLGHFLTGRGRLGEAEAAFRRCLAASEASGSSEGRWSAREGLGRVAAARGGFRGALAHFDRALAEIERVRAGLARGRRRAGYFGDKRAVYAAAVAALSELERREPGRGHAERALEVVQRAKARDLLDALGPGRRSAAPLDAAALREHAGDGAVLEYFLGEARLYRWVVRRGGIRMADLGPHGPVLDAVARVHKDLARGESPSPTALAALSRTLLGEAGPLGDGPLRIAPDGRLHYLPFELLEVAERTVSYLPSASTLGWLGRERQDADLRLLGVGAPRLPRGESTPLALLLARFDLGPLPAAERELRMVGEILGGRSAVLTGDRATEGAFRAAVARGARVVHVATHTVIDERPGRGAAILLSPQSGENEDDGLLAPEEIAGLDNRSALTVLAACRTALGPGEDGQALASLTGSFLAAGSRAVVATLWEVGDAATAVFMEQFYGELARGHAPAEALRRAKRTLRDDPRWDRPTLWSGYVLVGDAPAVVPGRRLWMWGVGVILMVAVLAWWTLTPGPSPGAGEGRKARISSLFSPSPGEGEREGPGEGAGG